MIPYGRQNICEDDISAVVDVLRSDFLTQGPKVYQFEQAVSEYCGANYAVATNNATAALHIACLALDVSDEDFVWTSANSFVASANCARYCGAQVDFIDINKSTGNISIEALTEKLSLARQSDTLPKVVIPVHFAGQSCDMEALHKLSLVYGFSIIEDASHALGGQYKQKPIGSCRYSDICVFSFHPVKMITTAEGGMAITNSDVLDKKLRLYGNHGIVKESQALAPWFYEQHALGHNYRMPDLNAALGLNQLSKLNEWVEKRNQLANFYKHHLASLNIECLTIIEDCTSSYHLFVILLAKEKRLAAYQLLKSHGIATQVHYIPIVMQPDYQALGFSVEQLPTTQQYYEQCLTLPLYPDLTHEQQGNICSLLATLVND